MVALVTALLLVGCGDDADDPVDPLNPTTTSVPTATSTGTPRAMPSTAGSPRVLTRGLRVPWGLAFLPDGSALVGERDTGRIHRLRPDGSRTQVATVPGVEPQGEGGLLGLAVGPAYAQDRWVYAYYTAASDNRVVRFRLDAPARQQVLLSGIPRAGNHNGGRLAFGPDGKLYAGTGDAGDRSRAQDPASLGGKVLRLEPTGGAARGNPSGSPVWSLGHRNVQGLAFDEQGRLWATEFGQNDFDEVNLITRGGNYGWPLVEGAGTGGGRFVAPKVTWRTEDASPSGMAFAAGALHVAALRGTRLYDVPLDGDRAGTPTARLRNHGRLRTVVVEPGGGALWVATSNCDGRGDCGPDQDVVLRVPISSS
jgi:glucose/arabinose dehydrogenase